MVVDQNNENILKALHTGRPRGLAFDLQENIFICIMGNKLRLIRYRGDEGRDIDLPGFQQAYNIMLDQTGEKVLILDHSKKFCVYKLMRIYMNRYSLCSVLMYLLE